MDCSPVDTWFRLVLNLLTGGMMGYWWMMVRRERRELKEIAAMRARVEQNLNASTVLLEQVQALSGDDDDAWPVPQSH